MKYKTTDQFPDFPTDRIWAQNGAPTAYSLIRLTHTFFLKSSVAVYINSLIVN